MRSSSSSGFESARKTSMEAVADTLDIDPSTAREHLQRAQRNLLGAVVRE